MNTIAALDDWDVVAPGEANANNNNNTPPPSSPPSSPTLDDKTLVKGKSSSQLKKDMKSGSSADLREATKEKEKEKEKKVTDPFSSSIRYLSFQKQHTLLPAKRHYVYFFFLYSPTSIEEGKER